MEWISVEDRLPEGKNQWRSCWWMGKRSGRIPFPVLFIDGFWQDEHGKEIHNVTHWMPLPAPPEDK